MPVDVFFLCTGNINRSALAHVMALKRWPERVVASGGTVARRGQRMTPRMRARAIAIGCDPAAVESFRSSSVTSSAETREGMVNARVVVGFQESHVNAAHRAGAKGLVFNAGDVLGVTKIPDPHYDSSGATHDRVVEMMAAMFDRWNDFMRSER